MYRKILLPTDGSTYAVDEVERATKLIADGGEIIVLSVAGKIPSYAFQRKKDVQRVNKEMYDEAQEAVDNMAEKFDDYMKVTKMVEVGFPADKINEIAEREGVDLIIITSSGKSGLHRFIIGSVAEKVLKTSEIDVLLVHSK
ncbi:MAG: universal stress protein [Methanobrevibacter sp.]|nr:universal stress protein [Methanobrevibacter sp.]